MKNTIISLVVFSLIMYGLFAVYQVLNHTYIKAEFKHIDPLPSRMDVFYKGYKLGRTRKLKISNDFQTTYLYITLNQRGLHLPKNISVEIKNYDKDTKYVDIIYPAAPQLKFIKTGDVIKGKSSFTFSGISDLNQAHLDDLSEKGENLLSSAKNTTESLTEMFNLITDILNENRLNIYQITSNLRDSTNSLRLSTENLQDLSGKINNGITEKSIRNSTGNIELLTGNFAKTSDKFYLMSGSLESASKTTGELIKNTNSLVDIAKMALCNINDIIEAFKETLRKRMGGARILFKQPVK